MDFDIHVILYCRPSVYPGKQSCCVGIRAWARAVVGELEFRHSLLARLVLVSFSHPINGPLPRIKLFRSDNDAARGAGPGLGFIQHTSYRL